MRIGYFSRTTVGSWVTDHKSTRLTSQTFFLPTAKIDAVTLALFIHSLLLTFVDRILIANTHGQ